MIPTQEQVREILNYNAETGIFHWKIKRSNIIKAGSIAGCLNKDGYIVINIAYKQYVAHRLAWLHVHGEWAFIDHKDGDGKNNRLENLRPATQSQNCANRRHNGRYLKGTYYSKRDRLWTARIMKGGVISNLGCFKSEADAHAAYCKAAVALHGEFARFS